MNYFTFNKFGNMLRNTIVTNYYHLEQNVPEPMNYVKRVWGAQGRERKFVEVTLVVED